MSCACISRINDTFELDGTNSVIETAHVVDMQTGSYKASTVRVKVSKRDPRKKERVAVLIPTYCPFCGVKYEESGS